MGSRVDYSRPLEIAYLSCPDITDTLATVEEKMKAINRVVTEGKSVSVHMGLLDGYTMDTAEDVEEAVIARELTPVEKLLYTSWKGGSAFPAFDFQNFKIDVTHDAAANTRYAAMVEAMGIIWTTDKATPANAAYASMYMHHLTPLLVAVMKIQKAKGESRWGFPRDPSVQDQVEAETIEKVTNLALKIVSREVQRTRMLARSVVETKGILMARKRYLDARAGRGANDNSTPDTQQQQQTVPQTLESRPLPQTPTPNRTRQEASNTTTPMPSPGSNRRTTQPSEGTSQIPQRKFAKTEVSEDSDSRMQHPAGVSCGTTHTQDTSLGEIPESSSSVPSPQRHARQRIYYRSPLSIGTNTVPAVTPTSPTTNRAFQAPAATSSTSNPTTQTKQNYKRPRVSDGDESEDRDR